MIKYLVFDLDGTLAPIGGPSSEKTREKLRSCERAGFTVCLCSGKPAYYLCGFARQLGLRDPVLIGENGAVLYFGLSLPPKEHFTLPFDHSKTDNIEVLKKLIEEELKEDVWFQPNSVALTPFISNERGFETIDRILASRKELLSGLSVYKQKDCYDILPCEISKKSGLEFFCGIVNADPSEIAAFGDGVNDVPMLSFAGLSIGIGKDLTHVADHSFDTIEEALDRFKELCEMKG